jgi:hypothetical protein
MSSGADSEPEAGSYLDRLIELRVFGRKPLSTVPAYSTNEDAAELVIARLNRPPLRWISLKDGDAWTFHWRSPTSDDVSEDSTATRYARLVSSHAPTRPLAICRAALKLVTTLDPNRLHPAPGPESPEALR